MNCSPILHFIDLKMIPTVDHSDFYIPLYSMLATMFPTVLTITFYFGRTILSLFVMGEVCTVF